MNNILTGSLLIALNALPILAHAKNESKPIDFEAHAARVDTLIPPVKLATNGDVTPEETAAVAKEWLANLDLALPEMASVKACADKQDWAGALDAYRDVLLESLSRREPWESPEEMVKWNRGTAEDIMNGFAHVLAPGPSVAYVRIGQPGAIDWFNPFAESVVTMDGGPATPEVRVAAERGFQCETNTLVHVNLLVPAYLDSGNIDYLKQWLGTWEDFTLRERKGFQMMTDAKRQGQYDSIGASQYQRLLMARRVHRFMTGLELLASRLPKESYNLVNSTALARVLNEIHTNHLAVMIQTDGGGVPNQLQASLKQIFGYLVRIPGLARHDEWMGIARDLAVSYYSQTVLPDGTSYEQAMNYNWNLPQFYVELKQLFAPENPAWLDGMREQATNCFRYLLAVQRNGSWPGSLPRVGGHDENRRDIYIRYAVELENEECNRMMNHLYGDESLPEPSFTSIDFPYTGYYVLRDGWDKEDSYLFFKASPQGRGHMHQDDCGIMLAALGQDLLVEAGNGSYNPHDRMKGFFKSSWCRNTIQVDGESQAKVKIELGLRGSVAGQTLQNLFHTSDSLDYAEGTYDHGYADPEILVKHERSVISLRNRQVWIVTDRLRGELQPMPDDEFHSYSQTWTFSDHFGENDVTPDNDRQRIATSLADGVNLRLRAFGRPVAYTKFFGFHEGEVHRGWQPFSHPEPFEKKSAPPTEKPPGDDPLAKFDPKEIALYLSPDKPVKNEIIREGIPIVQIQAEWSGKGEQLVVTLIDAGKGSGKPVVEAVPFQEADVDGFDATLDDGTVVLYRAALQPSPMKAAGVSTTALTLLTVTSPDGKTEGLVIKGSETLAAGTKIAHANAAFTLVNGALVSRTPLSYPPPSTVTTVFPSPKKKDPADGPKETE